MLYTETYGTGETIVLVHGWAMHTGIWRDFARQLAGYCRVVCVDLPGHGRSPKLPFNLEQIRAELSAALPERPCYWLGWSLGAKVVLDFAAHYPARVKGVVLMAGNPCFKRNDGWPGMATQALENFAAALEADCQAVLQRFLGLQVHGMEGHKALAKALHHAVQECPPPDLPTLRGGLAILEHADLTPALVALQCPLQVILGGRDTLVPIAVGDAIARTAPAAQILGIPKAAHVPFITHPDEVIASLRRFIGQAL